MTRSRGLAAARLVSGLLAASMLVVACSSEDDGGESAGEPITLTYWSWAPNIEKIVDVWNESHPDIQVRVNTSTGGDEIVAKLTAANQAGDLPDLSNTTYQDLPALIIADIAADLTDVMGDREDETAAPAWTMTTFDDVNYAVPQGTSPMFLFYRTDVFAEHGLPVPTTWEQYAQVARDLHAADPSTYLATFPANDAQLFAGLSQQAGSSWWSVDGEGGWSVDIDDDASRQVADFWEGLVAEDVVSTMKTYTPEWQAALADGTLASLIGAVWTPPILANNAPDTVGSWAAVPLPQWDPAEPASGVLGGSATIVTTGTDHPEEAREFALWLNTSDEALNAYIEHASIWPAALSGRELPELQGATALMPEQTDFYQLAAEIDEITVPVTWGPNVPAAFDSFTNHFSAAVTARSGFADALAQVQSDTVADLERAGYEVSE
ncbi:ABC transporter substrate-binding protein [Jiangella endophytica]|uniref:ABC transporter substrate-binding protein n=1 Tax=Jiangella endophytica TaxID=1623398 RepID=UPI000E357722|nr:extracellular solute-binding protein [Jiangella endophytica]